MKTILVIALLFFSALATKADEYYDIPAGWEKVVEFESNLKNIRFTSRNQLLFLESPRMYSKNGGLTFEPFNYLGNSSIRHFFFIEDNLYLSNNVILFKVDLLNNQLDSVKSSNSNNLGGYFELTYSNQDNSKIALSYFNGIGIIYSFDNGITWNNVIQSKILNQTPFKSNCNFQYRPGSDNYYSFLFDCKNPNRWLYLDYYSNDWTECFSYFITEDFGKTYTKYDDSQNMFLADISDKYFGFDNSNSVIRLEANKQNTTYNCFKFIDIYLNRVVKTYNMDSIMANYLKVDSVNEVSVAIDYNYYLTKDNKILFMSYDNLQSKSKDTIFQKMFLFDYKTMKLEQLMDRNIPTIKDKSFSSYSILHFDYNGGYVYYDLTAPQKPNELQKKIIIRKKLQDPTSVEEELPIGNHYQSTRIELYDILGRSIATFTSYEKLKAEIENFPPPHLIKWLDEKGISHFERMK